MIFREDIPSDAVQARNDIVMRACFSHTGQKPDMDLENRSINQKDGGE